ncbi:MAG: ABC transporter permease, partial [Candidatus Thorarchaeota archaeon]
INLASSNRSLTNVLYAFILIIFVLFVILPTTFVLIYVPTRFSEINIFFHDNPSSFPIIFNALVMSFAVSLTVTFIDLIFGFSLAWILSKKNFRGKELINTLIESPLAIPTAGLGFSVAIFWARTPLISVLPIGSLQLIDNSNIFLAIVLFHFTTTFPYVVRSLTEILEEIDKNFEIVALTCGASKLTAARTVTMPMFRSGFSTAAVLSLAKSLSDTGGVVTLLTTIKGSKLVDTDRIQATALIDIWKGVKTSQYDAALSFVSFLMIILSLILILSVKIFIRRAKAPTSKVYPNIEHKISKGVYVQFRNSITTGFIVLFVFIPSFFIFAYLLVSPVSNTVDWGPFFGSIFISLIVASLATIINILIGIPIAILITRKRSRVSSVIDALVDVPYLVPSAALGISVALFWKSDLSFMNFLCGNGLCIPIPDIILVIFAHMSMTFPFIARNVIGGLEEFNVAIEETARTLGARPLQVFTKITLPSIKGSILAGAVMGFTRSIGETGATLAVSGLQTAPVYIVNQIKQFNNYSLAAVATLFLTVIVYLFILSAKLVLNTSEIKKTISALRESIKERSRKKSPN